MKNCRRIINKNITGSVFLGILLAITLYMLPTSVQAEDINTMPDYEATGGEEAVKKSVSEDRTDQTIETETTHGTVSPDVKTSPDNEMTEEARKKAKEERDRMIDKWGLRLILTAVFISALAAL